AIGVAHVDFFFFQAEDGIRDFHVTGVQTCALPISLPDETRAYVAKLQSAVAGVQAQRPVDAVRAAAFSHVNLFVPRGSQRMAGEIGRASCRERVWISGGGGPVR